MRPIQPGEPCLTAAEISARFAAETGIELHPTNVGKAAKALGLDYLEREAEPVPGQQWSKPQRLYAEADVPAIFSKLQAVADSRTSP